MLGDLHALPLRDSSVDEIHSRHTMEHVRDPLACISEMYRVVKPGGTISIIVPHYSNNAYWSDLTHLRPFGVRTFEYYDREHAKRAGLPVYLPGVNLRTRRVSLTWWPERIFEGKSPLKGAVLRLFNGLFSGLANVNPFLCERLWCYWVGGFYEVTFELEPIKTKLND